MFCPSTVLGFRASLALYQLKARPNMPRFWNPESQLEGLKRDAWLPSPFLTMAPL